MGIKLINNPNTLLLKDRATERTLCMDNTQANTKLPVVVKVQVVGAVNMEPIKRSIIEL